MAEIEFNVQGLPELEKALQGLIKTVSPAIIEPILMDGAIDMHSKIMEKAPEGPTGTLRDRITIFYLPKLGENARRPIITSHAPHDHLVEFGSKPRWQKYTRKYTGSMPANPFFRNTVDVNKERIISNIVDEISQKIDGEF